MNTNNINKHTNINYKLLFCKMLTANHDDMLKQINELQNRHTTHKVELKHHQEILDNTFNTFINALENLDYLINYFYTDTQLYIEATYECTTEDCIFLSKEKQDLLKELTCKLEDAMKVAYKAKKLINTNK